MVVASLSLLALLACCLEGGHRRLPLGSAVCCVNSINDDDVDDVAVLVQRGRSGPRIFILCGVSGDVLARLEMPGDVDLRPNMVALESAGQEGRSGFVVEGRSDRGGVVFLACIYESGDWVVREDGDPEAPSASACRGGLVSLDDLDGDGHGDYGVCRFSGEIEFYSGSTGNLIHRSVCQITDCGRYSEVVSGTVTSNGTGIDGVGIYLVVRGDDCPLGVVRAHRSDGGLKAHCLVPSIENAGRGQLLIALGLDVDNGGMEELLLCTSGAGDIEDERRALIALSGESLDVVWRFLSEPAGPPDDGFGVGLGESAAILRGSGSLVVGIEDWWGRDGGGACIVDPLSGSLLARIVGPPNRCLGSSIELLEIEGRVFVVLGGDLAYDVRNDKGGSLGVFSLGGEELWFVTEDAGLQR